MKVYTIDNDGYIVGIKDVGENCNLGQNDFKGEPKFKMGQHYLTGDDRPIPQEAIIAKEVEKLKEIIINKQIAGMPVEAEQSQLRDLLAL